ncbi:MAG: acetyltransferase [Clostridia bacterium]
MNKDVIILGAGGHGKVIMDIIKKNGDAVVGFLDDNPQDGFLCGLPVLGPICAIENYREQATFVLAVGSNETRKLLAETFAARWYTAIHPSAQISEDVKIGAGTVVMANAVINASSIIGKHCIINTGAIVEHDNTIGDYVHLSPQAVLCGTVQVGALSHIGAGAVVINNITIGERVTLGAGAVVVRNICEPGTYVGVPARRIS